MNEPPVTGIWPAPESPAAADLPTVPGYELLEEVGRGGMGVVFKARHAATDRIVALKVLRDGAFAGSRERERFRIEAQAAARMRHPNIVEVYEVGEHAGRPYFAMEFVEGGGLDRLLADRTLQPTEAAELIRTLALAVAHAHERKVVHRDLKPANILLAVGSGQWGVGSKDEDRSSLPTPHSPLSTPKVTDFGLAKRLDTDSTALTRDGAVIGTPHYMAPEQAAGRVSEIGPHTDVYALGATLYELLTGTPPFLADTWEAVVRRVIHDEPAPPTRLRPEVPRDLETICLKCLEKEPARRYATAAELAADLAHFLAGEPVAAVPPTSAERLTRLAARDGYEIVGEVGRGPRSVVYHARSGPLKHAVAVKVFPATACPRAEWDDRVRRAAAQWAVLSHPHLVPVLHAGWWDESPYLVTEYVANGNLSAALNDRPLPVHKALRLLVQLGEVVCYLHRQGVVHGNLKPTNVLLAADGIPRLCDLGPLPASAADLAYLAPESVSDPSAEPRPYTDVYGLGLILYELLTGRPAFAGATATELREDVLHRDPTPPSAANPEVSPELEWLCLKCLRKNPWVRFTRAYDLVSRASRLLRDTDGRRPAGE